MDPKVRGSEQHARLSERRWLIVVRTRTISGLSKLTWMPPMFLNFGSGTGALAPPLFDSIQAADPER
jgi:hypothetical protein